MIRLIAFFVKEDVFKNRDCIKNRIFLKITELAPL